MACRGVHFAITEKQRDHLLGLGNDDDRVDYVQRVVEKEAMGGEFEHSYKTVVDPPEPGAGNIFVVGGGSESDDIGAELAKGLGSGVVRIESKGIPQSETSEPTYAETDKAWDAIHRCLSEWSPTVNDGALDRQGSPPLNLCVLGGRKIMDSEERYIIRLLEPLQVVELSVALEPITKDWMRERYFKHCNGAWPEFGEDDFEYTWGWFEHLRAFFARTVSTSRAVIFSVDQ